MNRIRTAVLAALMVCAVSLGAAGTASAQGEPFATPMSKKVTMTGTKHFKGTYTIQRFTKRNGQLVAVGKLRGTMRKKGKTKRVAKNAVIMPASVAGAGPAELPTPARAAQQPLPDIPNACQVLNLTLGPINLNLLGLVVRTNQIQVRIDAVPGAGNLLGNLLCAVTNLLNPTGALGRLTDSINNLAAVLNSLLALVPQSPAAAAAAAPPR